MKHLTEAMESLQVVFFSMVARTFPASSLNSSTAPMALPLSSNAYQLYLSYYILFHIYLLFYQKFSVFTCYCMLKWSAETSGLLWSSGKGQARIGKGWLSRWKASKLKPEPRAYTKVGCHPPPPPPPTTRKSQYTWLMAWYWPGEASGGEGRCVGSLGSP